MEGNTKIPTFMIGLVRVIQVRYISKKENLNRVEIEPNSPQPGLLSSEKETAQETAQLPSKTRCFSEWSRLQARSSALVTAP